MFDDTIDISLTFSMGGASVSVKGGQVRELSLNLQPWAFQGEISFWVSSETEKDELLPLIQSHDIMRVSLETRAHLAAEGKKAVPLRLKGLVTEKALLHELTVDNLDLKGDPVLFRYYRICFSDEASVIWKQHYPADVLPDGTLKDLIASAACGLPLEVSMEALSKVRSVNVLPGYTPGGGSFYDFIVWLTQMHDGVFFLDYESGGYALASERPRSANTVTMDRTIIQRWEVHYPKYHRYQERLRNSNTTKSETRVIERQHAAAGVYRDLLVRDAIDSTYEARCTREKNRVRDRGAAIHLEHCQYPWFSFYPGKPVKLAGEVWSDASLLSGQTLRVFSVDLKAIAEATRPETGRNLTHGHFSVTMRSMAEYHEDPFFELPPFIPPAYPIAVEGKVVSDKGKQEQKTYQIIEDTETSQAYQKVSLPIFGGRQVVVPIGPGFAPGHFYFPPFKDQRVVVALELHSAKITGYLDYRPGGQLPRDSQGNHVLFGKTEEDGTSIGHVYVDGKPQLNIRRTFGKDKASLLVHEGSIVLETREDT